MNYLKNKKRVPFFTIGLTVFSAFLLISLSFFLSTEASPNPEELQELQEKIEIRATEIETLEKEIAEYQKELQRLSQESNTLRNAIETLEISRKKLEADIKLTENRIAEQNSNIEELNRTIIENEEKIEQNLDAIAETIRRLNQAGTRPIVVTILSFDNINDFLTEIEELERFQIAIQKNIEELNRTKKELERQKKENEEKREELRQLQRELGGQKQIVEYNKEEQEVLLSETRNTESEYQRLVAERRAQKASFEQELYEFESQLRRAIDQSSIPQARAGLLQWPLDNIFITQMFGKTVDSERLYVSGTHNGVDFRASTGTRVKSAANGIVKAVYNTDDVPGCYSFGRWILITHDNGLSTLYAHLSSSLVSAGEEVKSGQVIGYSGGSPGTPGAGYSTGPHLHFGVYASQGVEPRPFVSNTPCNGAMMPLADRRAYMDPLIYLPPLQ